MITEHLTVRSGCSSIGNGRDIGSSSAFWKTARASSTSAADPAGSSRTCQTRSGWTSSDPNCGGSSCARLPFRTGSFASVINSEVIEHVPDCPDIWSEMWRVLRPGGILVVGTPDYGRWLWWVLEWIYGKVLPGAYAHEHITHFTNEELTTRLRAAGYEILDCQYVG